MKSYAVSFLALLAVLGCSNAPAPDTTPTVKTTTTSATGSTEGTTKPNGDATTAKAPDPSTVPASVKTDAFSYFGLDNDKTMNVELRVSGREPQTGGVTVKLTKVDADSATYEVERTGGIADELGSDTIVVDKTGVYITGNTTGTISPAKSLQLPAVVTPGTKWPSKSKVSSSNGQELEDDSTFVVKGVQSITTKAGKYDALVVTSTGTALVKTIDGQKKAKYDTTTYYVKGKGMVKASVTMTFQGKTPNEIVIEETK